jgi:hypothetical protein
MCLFSIGGKSYIAVRGQATRFLNGRRPIRPRDRKREMYVNYVLTKERDDFRHFIRQDWSGAEF